jgi:DNA repair photolyase
VLFPHEEAAAPRSGLVGIARLAAESHVLRTKAQVEYFELESRSILNRCSSPRMPFRWTINPYRGCEIGCKYCYARYTHEFMGMEDGALFEEKIYAKANVAALLRSDLRKKRNGAIAIGTSTDPYQPAERRFERTKAILEVFAENAGRDLSITTKSDLVTRDVELLQRVADGNRLSVNVTITTIDAALARKLEPRAPRPDLRLAAVRRLAEAGIAVGVFANPVMPGLTGTKKNLSAVAAAARQAGATYFGGGILFLMPSAQQQFFPFLDEQFPELAVAYRSEYGRNAYLRGEYADALRERIREVRAEHGLDSRPPSGGPPMPDEAQLSLFD